MFSVERDGFVQPLTSRPVSLDPQDLVVTFDNLLAQEPFVNLMRGALAILEEAYQRPVDIEFTGEIVATYPRPQAHITLLQCRTLSRRAGMRSAELPENVPEGDVLFTANRQVPTGCVDEVRYIVYVDPHAYAHIPEPHTRFEIGQVVGRINQALVDKPFILMGPGRWGTSNIQLGVKVTYADIYNTRVLIEIAYAEDGSTPEVSYGTHFFQDLVEANIYPLPLYPRDSEVTFNEDFFHSAPNALAQLLPADERFAPYVKVIDIGAVAQGRTLSIVMNGDEEKAIAYLTDDPCCELSPD